jgi:hypothetical protein
VANAQRKIPPLCHVSSKAPGLTMPPSLLLRAD